MTASTPSFAGQIAWVTGSSRGIGRAIADHLASLGASVVVHGTSPSSGQAFGEAESLQAVADDIASRYGVTVIAHHGDLTIEQVSLDIVASVERELGPIDVLVNCAGGDVGASGTTAPLAGKPANNDALHISLADLHTVLDRNLMTCILCCRAVAPSMMARRTGAIVNIGSIAGLTGLSGSAIYATAKAAVHEYSRCLAQLLRPYNVRVNVVAPGDTLSQRFAHSRDLDPALMVTEGTLLRYGTPQEIAQAVAFLASNQASYISGQVLRVDGGLQTWPA
ncbi:MAG: SDR family oxidoreductase [Anaerolineales bacterium]